MPTKHPTKRRLPLVVLGGILAGLLYADTGQTGENTPASATTSTPPSAPVSTPAPDDGARKRSTEDTLAQLERLARSGKLSFEELKAVNETMARLREALRERSRGEEEGYFLKELRTLLTDKADKERANRLAALEAARFLLYAGEADQALKYLMQARPASQEDIEWPLLATRAYLQLGDYARAAIMAERVEGLLKQRSPLLLSVPVAASQVMGYRMFQEETNTRFKPSDMLTLYLEINGAKFINAPGGGARCSLDFGLELRDQLQNVLDLNDNYGKYDPAYNGEVRDLHATIYYRIPASLDPGQYTLVIRCRDEFAKGAEAQVEYVFSIEGARLAVPRNDEQEKDRLRAAQLQQQLQSGKTPDLVDPLADLTDLLDTGEKKKEPAKDLMKHGLEMMLDQSKRAGDLLNK